MADAEKKDHNYPVAPLTVVQQEHDAQKVLQEEHDVDHMTKQRKDPIIQEQAMTSQSHPSHAAGGVRWRGGRRVAVRRQEQLGASLDEWPDGQEEQPSGEKSGEEVASLFMGAVDRRGKCDRREGPYDRRDWQAWERILKQTRQRWESYKAGDLGANFVDSETENRLDDRLWLDCLCVADGCCICSLDARVEQSPQEYIAAHAEKIRELGFKTRTLKFQNGDVQNLKFSVMAKLHKPLVAACKVVAAGNRIVLQPESRGGSFIEDVCSKHRKRPAGSSE